ncbi:unnamed protein product [Rhizophagus irregularis]|nr:unnamed protein product [Rhizophagus irregularis]
MKLCWNSNPKKRPTTAVYLSITSKELAVNFGIEISPHVPCFGKISQKKGDCAYKTEKWALKTSLSTFIITSLNSFSS